jgi:hypothetical protein
MNVNAAIKLTVFLAVVVLLLFLEVLALVDGFRDFQRQNWVKTCLGTNWHDRTAIDGCNEQWQKYQWHSQHGWRE